MPDRRVRWLALDVAAVISFVALGRDTHDEGLDAIGILETAAPFLIGLVIGWMLSAAARSPLALRTGVVVAAVTLGAGMALRRFAFDRGTAPSFVVVAAVFLFATIIGWRLVGRRITEKATVPLETPNRS